MVDLLTLTQAYMVIGSIALLFAIKLVQVALGVRRGGDIMLVAMNAAALGFLQALLLAAIIFLLPISLSF